MKLRINGNSMRLRLARSEVARLLSGVRLEEVIHFAPEPNAQLTYALQQDSTVVVPTVSYFRNTVEILLPAAQANTWGMTDQVGIAHEIPVGSFGTLALLVEKDFACLDRSEVENQDTFANPRAGATC